MDKSHFQIKKMDCAAEETLVRMKLESFSNIRNLDFDLANRKVIVYHEGGIEDITKAIKELNLGSTLLTTEAIEASGISDQQTEKKLLWTVLLINFGFFAVEIFAGFLSKSMGLVADSLDMLADAFVYGLSLFAIGRAARVKKNVAGVSGYFQMVLAVAGFAEVIRRFIAVDEQPDYSTMMIVSAFALVGNALCLFLLQRSKSREVHIRASMIFTSNDVIINMGVIAAGGLVYLFQSNKPDLIAGTIVFFLVVRGAVRILRLAR